MERARGEMSEVITDVSSAIYFIWSISNGIIGTEYSIGTEETED
jgi:hypothetical protein